MSEKKKITSVGTAFHNTAVLCLLHSCVCGNLRWMLWPASFKVSKHVSCCSEIAADPAVSVNHHLNTKACKCQQSEQIRQGCNKSAARVHPPRYQSHLGSGNSHHPNIGEVIFGWTLIRGKIWEASIHAIQMSERWFLDAHTSGEITKEVVCQRENELASDSRRTVKELDLRGLGN